MQIDFIVGDLMDSFHEVLNLYNFRCYNTIYMLHVYITLHWVTSSFLYNAQVKITVIVIIHEVFNILSVILLEFILWGCNGQHNHTLLLLLLYYQEPIHILKSCGLVSFYLLFPLPFFSVTNWSCVLYFFFFKVYNSFIYYFYLSHFTLVFDRHCALNLFFFSSSSSLHK